MIVAMSRILSIVGVIKERDEVATSSQQSMNQIEKKESG